MPFKSEAQRKKFYALYEEGKITKATLDKWESETAGETKKLPERLHKKQVSHLEKLQELTRNMKDYA